MAHLIKNKKGSSIVFQTVMFALALTVLSIFTFYITQDDDLSSTVSSVGAVSDLDSVTNTGFFSTQPVFIGLPAWSLSLYAVFGLWGVALVFGWIRGLA